MSLLRDVSPAAVAAGFVTVLVGFTSSAAIVLQAAQAAGATPAELASWIWALGLGMGATCIGLSLRYRVPVVTAWSTPGAAMLITAVAGLPMSEIIGAFMLSAALITLAGFSGVFERLLGRIPIAIAAGMLGGVLVRFGMDVFIAMKTALGLGLAMFFSYLITRRLKPRYAVLVTLAVGLAVAAGQGRLATVEFGWQWAQPVWTTPSWSWSAAIGVAIPLFIVTMASQNVPGVAVIRSSGYSVPLSPVIGWTGVANLLLAPFGGYALNLAAITAAICLGREAHEDPSRRYVAAVAAGVFYILIGLSGATVGALFAALPKELVMAIAGLALFGTIGSGLATALANEQDREPALITFLVTASGLTLFGIGSAFWGLIAGVLALTIGRIDSNWRQA
jgi:benzoate membrane transport protein